MYKTIRHGENSLQYTILPQTDDFRIEGKRSCSGSHKSQNKHVRRSRCAYLGVMFVCTVILGAVVIPFLISSQCLPNARDWFIRTKAALIHNSMNGNKTHLAAKGTITVQNIKNGSRVAPQLHMLNQNIRIMDKNGIQQIIVKKKANKNISSAIPEFSDDISKSSTEELLHKAAETVEIYKPSSSEPSASTIAPAAVKATNIADNALRQQNSTPMPVQYIKTTTSNDQVADHRVLSEIHVESIKPPSDNAVIMDISPKLQSTVNEDSIFYTSTSANGSVETYARQTAPLLRPTNTLPTIASETRVITALNDSAISSSNLMTRIIQAPLLKSTAKKLTTSYLPDIGKAQKQNSSKNNSSNSSIAPALDNEVITQKPRKSEWVHSNWPYIDPKTYFQWTVYKAEDSVLLPALLGFALIGVILIIAVCLLTRNKRIIVSSVRKRNRKDAEETGAEDNKTLLTTNNLSDDD